MSPRYVQREGAVQAAWANVRASWTPFDREAVLRYDNAAVQTVGRAFQAVLAAHEELNRFQAAGGWAKSSSMWAMADGKPARLE